MRYSVDVMQAAVRVLRALTEKTAPDSSDVAMLKDFDRSGNGRDLDELACDVIQKAVKRREQLRRAGGQDHIVG